MARTRKKYVPRGSSPSRGPTAPPSGSTASASTAQTAPGTSQTIVDQPTTSGSNPFGKDITSPRQSKPAFRITYEKDPYNHTNWEYQSVTKMPEYQSYSFEQLRWENYIDAKKFDREDSEKDEKDQNRENGNPQAKTKFSPAPPSFQLFGGDAKVSTNTIALAPNVHVNSLSRDLGNLLSFSDINDYTSTARFTSDVILKGKDNKEFYAHKLILACRSPHLHYLLYNINGEQNVSDGTEENVVNDRLIISQKDNKMVLNFTQHDGEIVEMLLRWIYTGQLFEQNVTIDPSLQRLKAMYEISDALDIHLLMEHCLLEIRRHITNENIAQLWRWSYHQKTNFVTREQKEIQEDLLPDPERTTIVKLFDELLLSIEGLFFEILPTLCANDDKQTSFYTWDEKV
jgi:hypothetical protein